MKGEILHAILFECKKLLEGSGADIILKTNFKSIVKGGTYSGNFILLDMQDGLDSLQFPGGLTRMDYKFSFNSYNYEPNTYVDDGSGYSEDLLNFIDMIRQHFSNGLDNNAWLTQEMTDIFNDYGFEFTFGGIGVAEAIETDGLMMGDSIIMESTALDAATLSIVPSASPLQTVKQVDNPPFDGPFVS